MSVPQTHRPLHRRPPGALSLLKPPRQRTNEGRPRINEGRPSRVLHPLPAPLRLGRRLRPRGGGRKRLSQTCRSGAPRATARTMPALTAGRRSSPPPLQQVLLQLATASAALHHPSVPPRHQRGSFALLLPLNAHRALYDANTHTHTHTHTHTAPPCRPRRNASPTTCECHFMCAYVWCCVVLCGVVCCGCCVVLCGVVWCCVVLWVLWCCVVLCGVVWCCVVLCGVVWVCILCFVLSGWCLV
jgi:hypothetical protein